MTSLCVLTDKTVAGVGLSVSTSVLYVCPHHLFDMIGFLPVQACNKYSAMGGFLFFFLNCKMLPCQWSFLPAVESPTTG